MKDRSKHWPPLAALVVLAAWLRARVLPRVPRRLLVVGAVVALGAMLAALLLVGPAGLVGAVVPFVAVLTPDKWRW